MQDRTEAVLTLAPGVFSAAIVEALRVAKEARDRDDEIMKLAGAPSPVTTEPAAAVWERAFERQILANRIMFLRGALAQIVATLDGTGTLR